MIAYTFLAEGSVDPFTGFAWKAGAWVDAPIDLERGTGVRACPARALPYWLDERLWLMEIEGEWVEVGTQILASRARLVSPVTAWPTSMGDFATFCAARIAELTENARDRATDLVAYLGDATRHAAMRMTGATAYIAAVAAETAGHGFEAERAIQAAWLIRTLALAKDEGPV